MPSSAIESVLRAYLGVYSQAGWEYAIECNWECLESLLRNVQSSRLGVRRCLQWRASGDLTWKHKSSRLGVYNRVQSGVYFRAYFGVCKKVHLAVVLTAACIVSSTHNRVCVIVI